LAACQSASGYFAGFDTVLQNEDCKQDQESKLHTLTLFVEKQKDEEDGQRYYSRARGSTRQTGQA